MVVLEQDIRLEASLCPVLHNATVLVWETGKSNHATEDVPMNYTGEVNKKGKRQ